MARDATEPGSILDQIPPEVVEAIVTNATASRDLIIVILLVALLGVVLIVMPLLYRSASPFMQRLMAEGYKELLTRFIDYVGKQRDEAANNDVMWDDPVWDWLYNWSKDQQGKADPPEAPVVG